MFFPPLGYHYHSISIHDSPVGVVWDETGQGAVATHPRRGTPLELMILELKSASSASSNLELVWFCTNYVPSLSFYFLLLKQDKFSSLFHHLHVMCEGTL